MGFQAAVRRQYRLGVAMDSAGQVTEGSNRVVGGATRLADGTSLVDGGVDAVAHVCSDRQFFKAATTDEYWFTVEWGFPCATLGAVMLSRCGIGVCCTRAVLAASGFERRCETMHLQNQISQISIHADIEGV